MSRDAPLPSWSVFEGWTLYRPRPPLSWSTLDPLFDSGNRLQEAERLRLRDEAKRWDDALAALGGDPAMEDMRKFRPLSVQREEAWSDWLAYLLESSRGGALARRMFAARLGDWTLEDFGYPNVTREHWSLDRSRRADIIAAWPELRIHIEVKTGDENFEKTFETAQKLREENRAVTWFDFILLPDASVPAWHECAAKPLGNAAVAPVTRSDVAVVTWSDVAVALRQTLLYAAEPIYWRVWAASFSAAIEQKLLGHPPHRDIGSRVGTLDGVASAMNVLTRGRQRG